MTPSPTTADLGRRFKTKYPGAYDDLSDQDVGQRVKAKYPGAYDDFTDAPSATPPQAQTNAALSQQGLSIGAPPKPPLPAGLSNTVSIPMRSGTGQLITRPAGLDQPPDVREKVLGAATSLPLSGASQIGQGVQRIQNRPKVDGGSEIAGGISDIARGAGTLALPFAVPGAIANPVKTAFTAGSALTAGTGAELGMQALGAKPGYSELGGTAAGAAAGVAADLSAKPLSNLLRIRRAFVPAMTQALKPTQGNLKFQALLDKSGPELNQSQAELGTNIEDAPKGKALDALLDTIRHAKNRVWNQYMQLAGPAANNQIDVSPVADGIIKSIPTKWAYENPEAAQAVTDQANKLYRRTMPLSQTEDFLHQSNAELDAEYAKLPPKQQANLTANPQVARLEAQANGFRDAIYNHLDPYASSDSNAAREFKQRYGSLMNLEEAAMRRYNVAARQQPMSLSEQIGAMAGSGNLVRGAWRGTVGMDPIGGMGDILKGVAEKQVSKWAQEQQRTDALIRAAFRDYDTLPTPVSVTPAPGASARLRAKMIRAGRIPPP